MRIFFEVNCNHDESLMELRNAEIYLRYLEQINSEIKNINFLEIVNRVARVMIENSEYNYVTLENLNISSADKVKLFETLDDNLIISNIILTGQGITKNKDEAVAFTFDEFRDFCLARYLLIHSERKGDNEYTLLFDKANEMFVNRQSPVEGIIKYSYYFKSKGRFELSKKFLICLVTQISKILQIEIIGMIATEVFTILDYLSFLLMEEKLLKVKSNFKKST